MKRTVFKRAAEYIDLIIHIRSIKQILSTGGYLQETGWKKSQWSRSGAVLNSYGDCIPWMTYPFLSFIEPRLNKNMRVFEYGCGYSTMWWADKCKTVDSVDSSKEWIDLVEKHKKENVKLFFSDKCENFCTKPSEIGYKYDIVIVDQSDKMDRNLALTKAPDYLTDNGIIVLDDSERAEYDLGTNHLKNIGFKRLDFEGLASTISYFGKKTSVFYRNDNVLNI